MHKTFPMELKKKILSGFHFSIKRNYLKVHLDTERNASGIVFPQLTVDRLASQLAEMLTAAVCPLYDQDYNKNREAMRMAGLRKEDTLGLDFKIQHPEI